MSSSKTVAALEAENAHLRSLLSQALADGLNAPTTSTTTSTGTMNTVAVTTTVAPGSSAAVSTSAGPTEGVLGALYGKDDEEEDGDYAGVGAGPWQETVVLDVPKEDWWVLVPANPNTPSAATPAPITTAAALAAAGGDGGGGAPRSGLDGDRYVLVDDRELKENFARFVMDTVTALPEAKGLNEEEVRAAIAAALSQASHGDLQNGGGDNGKITVDLSRCRSKHGDGARSSKQAAAPQGFFARTWSWGKRAYSLWAWAHVTFKLYRNPIYNRYMLTWAYKTASWALVLLL